MISTSLQVITTTFSTVTASKITDSLPATKGQKNRVGKIYLPTGNAEWLAAQLFHPVKAVQKDLFRYLVCQRREFCDWLKLQNASSPYRQVFKPNTEKLAQQEKLFSGISGFSICLLNQETDTPQSGRLISNNPVATLLPPSHAKFKVIGIEVIFLGLQEVLGLAPSTAQVITRETLLPAQSDQPVTFGTGNSGRKLIVASVQDRQISLADGARLLGVSTRTASRLRERGESSYSPVADYQVFYELLGRTKKKVIASRYGITERTVWNIQARVLAKLLELFILRSYQKFE